MSVVEGVGLKPTPNESTPNRIVIPQYNYGDTGPFLIMVSSKTNERNIQDIHPIKLGRELKIAKVQGIDRIMRKGRARLGIEFQSVNAANMFLKNEDFKSKQNIDAFIPTSLVTCKGIIRGIPTEINPEELLEMARAGVGIIHARRLNKRVEMEGRVEYKPTQSMVLTFAGKRLPKEVDIDYYKAKVNVYVAPVIQCLNCLRYGHSQKTCRSRKRCAKCQEEHKEEECIEESNCAYCQQGHLSTNRTCPEFERQKEIQELMAFENVSYYEARIRTPKRYETNNDQGDTQRRRELPNHSYRGGDFPELKQKATSDTIEVHERRRMSGGPYNRGPTFAQKTQSPKRKNTMTLTPPIDKRSFKEATFPVGARAPSSSGSVPRFENQNSGQDVPQVTLPEIMKNVLSQSQRLRETIGTQALFEEIDRLTQDYQMEVLEDPPPHSPLHSYQDETESF